MALAPHGAPTTTAGRSTLSEEGTLPADFSLVQNNQMMGPKTLKRNILSGEKP